MYNLFLDDIRMPQEVSFYIVPIELRKQYIEEDWVIVRSYDEFVEYIETNGMPVKISFDHDLADIHYDPSTWTESFIYDENTGNDCAKWLVGFCIANDIAKPLCYCHSMNPVGKQNILNTLSLIHNK